MTLVSAADLTVNEDNEFALGIIGVILPVGLVGLVVGYLLVKFTSLSRMQTFAGVGLIMYCLLLFADKNPIRKVAGPFKRLDQAHHANIQESFKRMETYPYTVAVLHNDDRVTVLEFSDSFEEAMARASELRQEHQREFVVEDYTDMDNIQVIHLEYERD